MHSKLNAVIEMLSRNCTYARALSVTIADGWVAIADSRSHGCNCRCSAAIAELLSCNCRLQIHSAGSPPKRGSEQKQLSCNCRLQMHSAGSPPKRGSEQKAAQLQLQIANALCGPSAHEGIGAKQLGCNCRLQIHSAGPRPKGGFEPHINRQIRPRGVKRGLGMQHWV